jgi:uncharacterized protein with HEPN domain
MRTDDVLLSDIVESSRAVSKYLSGISQEDFLDEPKLRDAVLMRLVIVGESAARLSEQLKGRYSNVPWRKAAGLRNLAVHDYFGILWPLVWSAAIEHLPELELDCLKILRHHFPEAADLLDNQSQ